MDHPIGSWRSVNHEQVLLQNWARCRGLCIGREGWAGKALFVSIEAGHKQYTVERRGSPNGPFSAHIPFRGQRSKALAQALKVMEVVE